MSEAEEVEVIDEETPLPKARNIYEIFETDEDLEREGVWIDFGYGQFRIAYIGGANQGFGREFAEKMKPYLKLEERGEMDPKIARQIQIECYVNHVVKDWKGVIGRDDEDIPFSKQKALELFTELPHLFQVIRSTATKFANYRKIYVSDVVGN